MGIDLINVILGMQKLLSNNVINFNLLNKWTLHIMSKKLKSLFAQMTVKNHKFDNSQMLIVFSVI